jgi:hypothetical protein
MLTRLNTFTFSLSFYTIFFSPSPLKPCGYSTFLIMMQNFPFSPNLYTTAWHVLRNDLHDLRLKCKLVFPSAGDMVTLLGMGLQKPISKWIPNSLRLRLLYLLDNDETRVVLTQPLRRRMTRFTLWSPWPSSVKKMQTGLSFFRLTLLGMGLQQTISKWIPNQSKSDQMAEPCGYCTCLIMMQHVQFSPNLYTTALTVLHVIFPATFKQGFKPSRAKDMQTGLQVELYNGNWKIINKHCIS